jgi:hypothetical protein
MDACAQPIKGDIMTPRLVLFTGIVLSSYIAGCTGSPEIASHSNDRALVTLEKAVHFQGLDDQDILVAPGSFSVEALDTTVLRLMPQSGGTPAVIQAMPVTYDNPNKVSTALTMAQGTDEQHVVLVLPGGRALDAIGSLSGIRGRGTTVPLPQSLVQPTLVQSQPAIQITDPCGLGRDSQPAVTRVLPSSRIWPGGKVVFEGQNLDATRFQAAIGSPRLALTIVSASPTRIETVVPSSPDGGPYSLPTGEPLTVAYKGTVGCKVLNPNYVVADPFNLRLFQGGGTNSGYFSIRHQMDLTGDIEGIRTITVLTPTDASLRTMFPDPRVLCDWADLRPFKRGVTLIDNRINASLFGFFRDHRIPPGSTAVACRLPFKLVIQDPITNISREELVVIPMTIRPPRAVSVDSTFVFKTFDGAALGLGGDALRGCGTLFEYVGDVTPPPPAPLGAHIQNNDWAFAIRSGIAPISCRYNSRPVETNLGVAFGPFIHWDVTKAGDPTKRTATVDGTIGILHRLDSREVRVSCELGPLGDNRVTVRGSSVDLLVPFEYMPPSIALEVQ